MEPKKKKASIFSSPYCWVENCHSPPEVETQLGDGLKSGVCTNHKNAWLNLIKFLS